MMKIIRHAALTAALLGAVPASAFPTVSGVMWPVVMNPCPAGKCPGAAAKTPRKAGASPASPDRAATSTTDLTFIPSAERRRANLATFVAKSNGEASIAQIAAKADLIFPQLETAMAARGMKMNNLADSYAAWWIASHDAVHGVTETRPAHIYRAVSHQAAEALAATPQIASANPAFKQQLADALLVQVILIDTSVDHARQDPQQLRAIGTAVSQSARRMGVDLTAMQLTDAGFRLTRQ
jgi:hypothetical protein